MTMPSCTLCGKPTKSHQIGDDFICHACYESLPSEAIEKLKKEAAAGRAEDAERLLMLVAQTLRNRTPRKVNLAENVTLLEGGVI